MSAFFRSLTSTARESAEGPAPPTGPLLACRLHPLQMALYKPLACTGTRSYSLTTLYYIMACAQVRGHHSPCHVVSCHVTSCYIMTCAQVRGHHSPCRVMSCHAMSRRATLWHVHRYEAIIHGRSCRAMSRRATLGYIMACAQVRGRHSLWRGNQAPDQRGMW